MDHNPIRQIALIGFGEVGGIFGSDFAAAGLRVSIFDILLNGEPARSETLAKAKNAKVRACDTLQEALQSADLIISAVTASSAADVAAGRCAIFTRRANLPGHQLGLAGDEA